MATAIASKAGRFSSESVKAGDRLLKAVKDRLIKKGQKLDYEKLRKDGYSESMIARLKKL